MIRQAFLFEIETSPIDNEWEDVQKYRHKGFYLSEGDIFSAILDIDPCNPSPTLFGDIAEVYTECTTSLTFPVNISFHAVLKSKIIKQYKNSEMHSNQLLAFEANMKKLEAIFNDSLRFSSNQCPINLSLDIIKELKKGVPQTIIDRNIPYSFYSYNFEKKQYVYNYKRYLCI